ncbi:MAG: FtsK/SpoIIIE domain-containing protein [Antricoccus sp.]
MSQLFIRPVPPRRTATGGVLVSALPALGGLGAVAYMFAGPPHPVTYIAGAVFAFSSLAMVASTIFRNRGQLRSSRTRDRTRYTTYLESLHEELDTAALDQWLPHNSMHSVILGSHPAPNPARPQLSDESEDPDPICLALLERTLAAHELIEDAPLRIDLDTFDLTIQGSGRHALARAVVCQLAAQSGLDFSIYSRQQRDWSWARWLPQIGHECRIGSQSVLPAMSGLGIAIEDLEEEILQIRIHSRQTTTASIEVGCDLRGTLHIAGQDDQEFVSVGKTIVEATIATRALRGRRITISRPIQEQGAANHCLAFIIGHDPNGDPVRLDISEANLGGQGPHGLIVGATGSGKSELLRTIVLSAIMTNTPQMLNLVLIDFKGGATFADLSRISHVAGTITNLHDDTSLVDRMREVLEGELRRRQQILHDAGGFASLRELNATSADGQPIEPVLLVIVDEFAELLSQDPELATLFVKIGRLGRSLGVHLLLATQRLDEGKIRGLEAHLSYRIALRVFSAAESRAAIGVPDAADLPRAPGYALLREGTTAIAPFRAHRTVDLIRPTASIQRRPPVSAVPSTYHRPPQTDSARSLADLITAVPQAAIRRLWLAPLTKSPHHDELSQHGAALMIPIGLIDRSGAQRRDPLIVDLRGAGSHVAIVGGPGSGKSTLAATLVYGAAAQQTAQRIQVYVIDTASTLHGLREIPHVGEVIAAADAERVRRLITILMSTLHTRQAASSTGWSLDQLRGERTPDGYGELVIVVDGFGAFAREYDNLLPSVRQLVERGASYGIHLIVTAGRWLDIRHDVRDLFATKIELKLADPVDSEIDRRAQSLLPRQPGHGLAPDGSPFLGAVPGLAPADRSLARAPRIGVLPSRVSTSAVRPAPAGSLIIGIEGSALSVMAVDTARHPGVLVLGEASSGKTSFLAAIGAQVAGWPHHRLLIVDPRRRLKALHCDERAHTPDNIGKLVADAITTSEPGDTDQVILIDDYDLLPSFDNPLQPLVDLLPYAVERGLTLVLCRRSSNVIRALADPLISGLIDNQAPVVLLSTPEDEGRIAGVRAKRQPTGRGILIHRDVGTRDIQLLTDLIPTPSSHQFPHLSGE